MPQDQQDFQESKVSLSKKHYITISSLVALFVWMITVTVLFVQYIEVKPLQEKLKSQEAIKSQNETLKKQIENLQHTLTNVLKDTDRPALQLPPLGGSLVGGNVTFAWKYKNHSLHQKYILELRNISDPKSTPEKYNVLNPERQLMHFPVNKFGEYLWRIRPGQILNGNIISQGPPSYYNTFAVYPSVMERIKASKVIRVGTSPTFIGYFNFVDHTGRLQGFDIDLIRWIAKKLSIYLHIPLKIEFFDIPWSKLLSKLQKHHVDLVISSMTATKSREKENPGVRFTNGYYQSHQIFIGLKKGGRCRQDLEGLRVGVNQGTTNEQAAKVLKDKFNFKLDNSHETYADLYRALEEKRIDYALVDDILVKRYLKDRFNQCGEPLDQELKSFYEMHFPQAKEAYGIAVMEEKGENLRNLINDILALDEGKEKLACLREKWIKSENHQKVKCDQP